MRAAREKDLLTAMLINYPGTIAELRELYPRYEQALVSNDVAGDRWPGRTGPPKPDLGPSSGRMEDCLRPRIDTSLKAALNRYISPASLLVHPMPFVPNPGLLLPNAILLGSAITFQLFFLQQLLEIHSAAFWAVTLS
jgi:hypothetical protein